MPYGGEAGQERCSRIVENEPQILSERPAGVDAVVRGVLRVGVEMNVGVDQAGQTGEAGEVHHCTVGNFPAHIVETFDRGDASSLNGDELIGEGLVKEAINQQSTPKH